MSQAQQPLNQLPSTSDESVLLQPVPLSSSTILSPSQPIWLSSPFYTGMTAKAPTSSVSAPSWMNIQHPVSPHSPESSLPPVTPTRQPLLDISNTQPTMAPSTLQVFPASTPSFFASQTQEPVKTCVLYCAKSCI